MNATMTAEVSACRELGITDEWNKWLALWMYNREFCTLEATQQKFDQHPGWRDA